MGREWAFETCAAVDTAVIVYELVYGILKDLER
jgi:hypothetical protein